jgi:hypothetical protein
MPRRPLIQQIEFETEPITLDKSKKCNLVSDKLKIDYLNMCVKLGIIPECIICYESVNCPTCFSITNCGNHIHLSCWVKCNGRCPMCRS